jgi:precorrin-6B methylase 2
MGVRHAREYSDILKDLTEAVGAIDQSYEFFDMSREDWEGLETAEREEVIEALADDVFYGLGEQPSIVVGGGTVTYHHKHHVIEVSVDGKEIRIVRLI